MTNVFAVIESGTVTNTIVWDGDLNAWQPFEGALVVRVPDGGGVSAGWTYDGKNFVAPPVAP